MITQRSPDLSEKALIFEKQDRIGKIIFNRPDVHNALNIEMVDGLNQAIAELEQSNEVRAVILTGSGEKAFISGTDLKQAQQRTFVSNLDIVRHRQRLLNRLENLPIPSIAAINGYAFGVGCEIAMACTMRIAAEGIKMGQLEINVGLMPGAGGTQRLPRLIGKALAAELLLTGRRIEALEAHEVGLVNRVVPRTQLIETCEKMAREIAEKSPVAVKMILTALNKGSEVDLDTGLLIELLASSFLFGTEDRKEGLAAFLEKRKPVFKGK